MLPKTLGYLKPIFTWGILKKHGELSIYYTA